MIESPAGFGPFLAPLCWRSVQVLPQQEFHQEGQLLTNAGLEDGWVGGWRGDAVAFRFQSPPVEPCVRFSRTRLTDALHRRYSAGPARPGWAWVRRRFH